MKLTDEQKLELQRLFPEGAFDLVERNDFNDLVDFLDGEVVMAFENDEPTVRSSQIERLMDSIIWNCNHRGEGETDT